MLWKLLHADASIYSIANEYRNWLLYYAIPILANFLPMKYYNHLLLLVKGIYTLLKTSITKNDLKDAELSLKAFVFLMDEVYGKVIFLLFSTIFYVYGKLCGLT